MGEMDLATQREHATMFDHPARVFAEVGIELLHRILELLLHPLGVDHQAELVRELLKWILASRHRRAHRRNGRDNTQRPARRKTEKENRDPVK